MITPHTLQDAVKRLDKAIAKGDYESADTLVRSLQEYLYAYQRQRNIDKEAKWANPTI